MGNTTGEMADRLHFLCLCELFAHLIDLALRLAPLCHVAGDFAETDQPPGGVVDRVEHGERPELGAVFAYAPTFIFEPAKAARRLQSQRRFAGAAVLFSEKDREVLAQNLAGFIAFDAPSAAVPTADPALGIQHINGVVRYRVYQY